MPNTYFKFKQFAIQQDQCAMKVCTDACLFGAWAAEKIQNAKGKIENVLDVGTGTGLLALMLAQKTDAHIDAIEIDESAAKQARENIRNSSWRDRINVHHSSLQHFKPTCQYDFIISNPPFFTNHLQSIDEQRNLALHSTSLSLQELLSSVKAMLSPSGCFTVLLPFQSSSEFEANAKRAGYYLQEKVIVKQTEQHPPFRSMLLFSRGKTSKIEMDIIIKIKGEYSDEFVRLLKEYYL